MPAGRVGQGRKASKQAADELFEILEHQTIARVVAPRGGSVWEVALPPGYRMEPAEEDDSSKKTLGAEGGENRGAAKAGTAEKAVDECALAKLPSKFNKLVWVKKGCYVVVERDSSSGTSNTKRILFSICAVLQPKHIKHLRKNNNWPACFEEEEDFKTKPLRGNYDNIGDGMDELYVNPNRRQVEEESNSEEESSEDD